MYPSIAGCLFHGRKFVSQEEMSTMEGISTWQVFQVLSSEGGNV